MNFLTRALLWKALSAFSFGLMNVLVRWMTAKSTVPISSVQVAFLQNVGTLSLLLLAKGQKKCLWESSCVLWQLMRGLLAVTGVGLWYASLSMMPVAHVVALGFFGPLLTTAGAWLILKETLSPLRLGALCAGILGGAIIAHDPYFQGIKPWYGLNLTLIFPILGAICMSGATLMTKLIVRYDDPESVIFYTTVLMVLVLVGPAWIHWSELKLWQWVGIGGLSGLSILANSSLNRALGAAQVTLLLPVGTVRILVSVVMGTAIFGESVSLWILLGGLCIGSALSLCAWEARKLSKELSLKV